MRTPKFLAAALLSLLTACSGSNTQQGECRIHGTLPSDKWDGQYIFIVPSNKEQNIGVDSTKIEGNSFELVTDKSYVGILRLHYRYRLHTQELLVVTEPGDVYAHIDTVSSCGGTPQNDSLQAWKQRTTEYRRKSRALTVAYKNFFSEGDSVSGNALREQSKEIYKAYKEATLRMAKEMEGTTLADFLNHLYSPKTKPTE